MSNKRKIKAALIDMDGTLYDSMPNHARAWMQLMHYINVRAREEEFFLYEGCTGAHIVDKMIRREFNRPATESEKVDLYALKAKYFVEQSEVPVMPGAIHMVEYFRQHDIDRVLVTGSGQNSLLSRLEKDFPGSFPQEKRVTSASVAHGKPHPEPFLKGLELAGVKADEAIAIDNAPLGVRSAHDAGVFTIGVVTGPIPCEELEKAGADVVYNSMKECADNLPKLIDDIEKDVL